jgi:hypothetical protein
VVASQGTAIRPPNNSSEMAANGKLYRGAPCDEIRNGLIRSETRHSVTHFLRAGREMTVGISTLGATSAKALNCSGLRNITEQPEQA